jgi:geranylgeranyl pyrophosphate synthase
MRFYEKITASLPKNVKRSIEKTSVRLSSFRYKDFVNPLLYKPTVHLFNDVGKLLRPTLVFIGADAIGEKPDKFVDLAVAAELIHTSSLIHDDIIDGDELRRGVEAVHIKYGKESAILAGDALISKAIMMSADYGSDVMRSISQASMDMCAGEILDNKYHNGSSFPSLKTYMDIARLKSASLIASCCNIVAVYGKHAEADRIYNFGIDLGLAFQIRDDVLESLEESVERENEKCNIVNILQSRYSLNRKEAVKKAVKMNNEYVNSAVRRINDRSVSKEFEKYADFVNLDKY